MLHVRWRPQSAPTACARPSTVGSRTCGSAPPERLALYSSRSNDMKTAILALVAILAASAAQAQGTISGCVATNVASASSVITVTIVGSGVVKAIRTDRSGCYAFKNLPPGSYELTATLDLPKLQDRDTVALAAGGNVALDFGLFTKGPDKMIDWAAPPTGLAGLWAEADAIVHVRVIGASPRAALQPEFFTISASILAIFKRDVTLGPDGSATTFLQERWHHEPSAYSSSTDLILFLSKDAKGRFHRAYGPHVVFAVREGIVEAPSSYSQYQGMKVDDFIAKLKALSKDQARGSIKGCVEDDVGSVLPGVAIGLAGPTGKHSATTDMHGCYVIRDLPAGRYDLTAEMNGFKTITRQDISVHERQDTTIDLQMVGSGIIEIDWPVPAGGLAGLWKAAAAVLRVHIDSGVRPEGRSFTEHTATVTEVFKRPVPDIARNSTVMFRQELWVGEPIQYPVGQDLVVFLDVRRGIFYRTCGHFGVVLINGDRIEGSYREVLPPSMKVEDFIAKLKALSKEGR